MFIVGEAYTRENIHEELGGSVQSFLPTVGGQVVCACLSKNMNPNAPNEILVGNKPRVMQSAEQFSKQPTPVPVFMKEASNKWVYQGDYFVKKVTHRDECINSFDLAGREDIQIVLELEGGQEKGTKRNPKWERDEVILALELYFREPKSHGISTHPEVIKLSELLNALPIHKGGQYEKFRNPNGVGMKLANFRSFDPNYDDGLSSASKLDREVWDDFSGDLEKLKRVAESIKSNYQHISSAEELDEDVEATEGRILTRIHQKRERSVKLVKKKKQQVLKKTGKLECEVCGFDYEKVYGKHGNGFAECHHTKPVSEIEDDVKTKLSDLAIVCANCHRMIHKSKPWLSLNEVRKMLG